MGPPKRKAPELKVPKPGDDPEERKRVLNVLAQRRYRQRRREHVKKLEAAASASPEANEAGSSPAAASSPSNHTALTKDTTKAIVDPVAFQTLDQAYPPEVFQQAASVVEQSNTGCGFDDSFAVYPTDLQLSAFDDSWALPSLPSSPAPSSSHSSSATSFSPSSSLSSPPNNPSSDSYSLPVSELTILRGATSIAARLNILSILWGIDFVSPYALTPLDTPVSLPDPATLPPNLRPTTMQLSVPHHPVLDILPWPSVRDKLILIFSIPAEQRPAVAASPTALAELAYDLEDSTEGVRIWGDDPYDDQNWEVGQKFWERWWWALDSDVVRRSNELRRMRGARLLRHDGGRVVGEVG